MEFRTEKDILKEMLENSQSNNLLNIEDTLITRIIEDGDYTENQYVLDLSTHAYILNSFETVLKEIYEGFNINTATGSALDRMGEWLNVVRSPATKSVIDLDITLIASEEDIFIPAGTGVTFENVLSNSDILNYETVENVTIPAGVTSITIRAESVDYGCITRIPRYSVTGLKDYTSLTVVNSNPSTGGRDIESDDDYRERLKNWYARNIPGTRACFDNFLLNRSGVDGYKLIPRYEGIGTLKVVVDCLESELSHIQEELQNNCMLYLDKEVVCVLPTSQTLQNLDLIVKLGANNINLTESELNELITSQTRVYFDGGTSRNGDNVSGLSIGQELDPSRLISFLLSVFPELDNIRSSQQKIVKVAETSKLVLENVTISFETGDEE